MGVIRCISLLPASYHAPEHLRDDTRKYTPNLINYLQHVKFDTPGYIISLVKEGHLRMHASNSGSSVNSQLNDIFFR